MTQGDTVDGTELSSGNCNDGSGGLGCPQTTNSTNNFGKGLNANGGGVYAMEWTSDAISVWFFPRNSTMQNKISSSNTTIDSSSFGTPLASFMGGSSCDIDNNFQEHWITINTDFVSTLPSPVITACQFANMRLSQCGQWAGAKWADDAECSAKAPTCEEYAAQDPNAFVDAYCKFTLPLSYHDPAADHQQGSSNRSRSTASLLVQQPPRRGACVSCRAITKHKANARKFSVLVYLA